MIIVKLLYGARQKCWFPWYFNLSTTLFEYLLHVSRSLRQVMTYLNMKLKSWCTHHILNITQTGIFLTRPLWKYIIYVLQFIQPRFDLFQDGKIIIWDAYTTNKVSIVLFVSLLISISFTVYSSLIWFHLHVCELSWAQNCHSRK